MIYHLILKHHCIQALSTKRQLLFFHRGNGRAAEITTHRKHSEVAHCFPNGQVSTLVLGLGYRDYSGQLSLYLDFALKGRQLFNPLSKNKSDFFKTADIDTEPEQMYKAGSNHGILCCGVIDGETDANKVSLTDGL